MTIKQQLELAAKYKKWSKRALLGVILEQGVHNAALLDACKTCLAVIESVEGRNTSNRHAVMLRAVIMRTEGTKPENKLAVNNPTIVP